MSGKSKRQMREETLELLAELRETGTDRAIIADWLEETGSEGTVDGLLSELRETQVSYDLVHEVVETTLDGADDFESLDKMYDAFWGYLDTLDL